MFNRRRAHHDGAASPRVASRFIGCGVILSLAACQHDDSEEVKHVVSPGPSAIIIVLDGVRVDEFTGAASSDLTGMSGEDYADEVWSTLGPDAAVVRAGLNDGVTITGPAHADMVTGAQQPFANLPVAGELGPANYRVTVPTIFEEATEQMGLGDEDVVILGNSELVSPMDYSLYPGLGPDHAPDYELIADPAKPGAPTQDDNKVFEAFKEHILNGPPRVMLGNVHDVDRAGHYGEGDAYIDDVKVIDGALADFWDWLKTEQPDYTEDLLVIVTADHGRHSHDEDDGWHNHGDSCYGCREVPLFVLGGGANAGVTDQGMYTTSDLAPTVAAHVGFDLPWAEGLPLSRLFDGEEMPARAGQRDVSVDGALHAETRFLDAYEARSEVRVGDEVLSTPGAMHAEDAVVVDGDRDYACFRELILQDGADEWPWTPRCLVDDGSGWTDIGFPDEAVSPFWKPALYEAGGVLYASWPYNPDFIGQLGSNEDVGVRSATWTPADGWVMDDPWVTYVPTDVVRAGEWVAFGTNAADADARYTRHVEVGRVGRNTRSFDLADLLGEGARVELPAIRSSGQTVELAMLGTNGDGWVVAWTRTDDNGGAWTSAAEMAVTGAVLPTVAPVWDGETLAWAELVGDEAQICRAATGDTPVCVGLGSPRVRDLEVHDGVITAVVDTAVGQWAEVSLD